MTPPEANCSLAMDLRSNVSHLHSIMVDGHRISSCSKKEQEKRNSNRSQVSVEPSRIDINYILRAVINLDSMSSLHTGCEGEGQTCVPQI